MTTFAEITKKQPIPAALKQEVVDRDGFICQNPACRIQVHQYFRGPARADSICFDHVYPESKGGLTVVENLQVLCRTCNLKKGAKVIDVRREAKLWYEYNQELKTEPFASRRFGMIGRMPVAWTTTGWRRVRDAEVENLNRRYDTPAKVQKFLDIRDRKRLSYRDLAADLKAAA